jgi:hypothetical protein
MLNFHHFKMLPESISHAIGSGSSAWERDGRGSLTDFLPRAFDLRVSNLHVLVEVHGASAREDQVHVQDE